MNAQSSLGTSNAGFAASMALPVAAANAAPQNPAFVNMISLFLSSADQVSANSLLTPVTTATPAQLADSMMKAMLGGASSGSTDSSPVATAPAAEQSTVATQLADSMIQSMFGSLSSGPVKASSTSTAAALPAASNKQKPLPSLADLPVLTAIVAPPPAPAISTTPTANQSAPITGAPNAAIAGAPQLPAPAVPATPVVKGEIAFTAILTPMKNLAPTGTADIAQPAVSPVATTASPASGSSALAIAASAASATAAAPLPPAASQTLSSQAAVPVAGKDSNAAQAGGDMQQGGDTPSQQDDSAGTQAKSAAPADAKVKTGNFKQDDNAVASTVVDRTPVGNTACTAFTEPARTAGATQSAAPAPAPTPFQSTAEALRTSESNLPAAPQLRAAAAQEISIRIAQPDSSTIDLRVVERSGQLHVDVRTTDAAMQTSLRQDLGTLTNSLNRAGYHSETFTPSSSLGRTASSSQMSNQDESQDQSQNRGGSGDSSGSRRQQQQQQQKRPSTWLEELETIQ